MSWLEEHGAANRGRRSLRAHRRADGDRPGRPLPHHHRRRRARQQLPRRPATLQLFTQDNFLIAGAGGMKGDTNSRFLGNLTINYTPWKYLELYLALYNSSNQNTRTEGPPQRTDPEVILALGDVGAGVKGRLPVTKWFDFGAAPRGALLQLGVAASASTATPPTSPPTHRQLRSAPADATRNVPLRFHVNFGYSLDNSSICCRRASARSSTTQRRLHPLARRRDASATASAQPLPPRRSPSTRRSRSPSTVGLEPFFEYHVDIAVGDGDTTVGTRAQPIPASRGRLRRPAEPAVPDLRRARAPGRRARARCRPRHRHVVARLPLRPAAAGVERAARRGLRLRSGRRPRAHQGRDQDDHARDHARRSRRASCAASCATRRPRRRSAARPSSTRRAARRRSSPPTTAASSATASRRDRCRSRSRATTTSRPRSTRRSAPTARRRSRCC